MVLNNGMIKIWMDSLAKCFIPENKDHLDFSLEYKISSW